MRSLAALGAAAALGATTALGAISPACQADQMLGHMPVTITDAGGKVVFDGVSEGPILLARLPRGSYTVTTRWDAWTLSRPITIGEERERVVFDWKRPAPTQALG
jgi:hypothetical protein